MAVRARGRRTSVRVKRLTVVQGTRADVVSNDGTSHATGPGKRVGRRVEHGHWAWELRLVRHLGTVRLDLVAGWPLEKDPVDWILLRSVVGVGRITRGESTAVVEATGV